jgi:Flp pilus assembly protein TadD
MYRRAFLRFLGYGALYTCGSLAGVPLVWSREALDYALEGQNLIQQERFLEAATVLKKAVALDPNSDWSHGLLGRAYHHNG